MNISNQSLTQAITTASIALARKASLPQYSQFAIAAGAGVFSVSATDGDQWGEGEVACNSAIDPFCVNAKSLQNILSLLVDNVWMELKEGRLFITSSKSNFNLATAKAEKFPSWSDKGSKAQGLNCQDLAEAIETVSFAASTDTINRTQLCCVSVECDSKHIQTIGFNGRELARMSKASISAKCDFLLPASMVKNFCAALRKDGAVFWLSEDKATVKHGLGEYSCKLWAGKYPDTERFLNFKRNKLGDITPALWLSILASCVKDEPEDNKLCSPVMVKDGFILHTGPVSQLEVPAPDPIEKCELRLNARALIPCLEQFKDKAELFQVQGENAIGLESGGLLVLSTLLR